MPILTVDEVFTSNISFRHEEIEEVSGFLVVSKHIVFLCAAENRRDKAILVVAPGLKEFLMKQVPAYAGTMVLFAGNASVLGHIAKSGLDPLPYALYQVERINFKSPHGMEVNYVPTAS